MPRGQKRRADGEGTIYEISPGSGKWKAELAINGRTASRRAKSRKEAAAKLAELRAMRDAGLKVGTGNQTLQEWQTYWLDVIAPLEGMKPATIQGHRYACAHYLWPELGNIALARLAETDIERWGRAMVERGMAQATIDNAMRRLRTSLNLAVRRKMIRENVARGVKIKATRQAVVSEEDIPDEWLDAPKVRTLLESARNHRLYALIHIAATLGPRQGELIGLRWSSVILEGPRPRIIIREQLQRLKDQPGRRRLHRETTKNEQTRELLLAPEHVAALKAHRTRQAHERLELLREWRGEDLVFTSNRGTPLEASSLLRAFHVMLRRAELPRVAFHSLRHTAGSLMLAGGAQIVDVSRVLGHSSPLITANIYAHSFEDGQLAAVLGAVKLVS